MESFEGTANEHQVPGQYLAFGMDRSRNKKKTYTTVETILKLPL